MKDRRPILIVGAGLAGLTLALALRRGGRRVQVLEQAHSLGEVGAGVQLSPNATRVLETLGLAEPLGAVASEPESKEIRLWDSGQAWKLFDLGPQCRADYGHPYYTLYRPDLHRVLAEAVGADAIVLGARCTGFETTDGGVVALLEDGRRLDGSLLVGADGVHSAIRRQLFGDGEAQFSGLLAWRGVIPADRLPPSLRRPVGATWIGPGAHVVHYPLRGGALVNFVGVVERDDWTVESWSTVGTREECAGDFSGWHEEVQTLIRNIDTPFKWALMQRAPMARWSVGRVTLVGDACHPTLPFMAQGACMAIEDGAMLARCLDEAGGEIQALRTYEAARMERTGRIVLGSADNAKRFHNPALASPQGAARYASDQWSEAKVRERYHWLFDYKVDEIALPPLDLAG